VLALAYVQETRCLYVGGDFTAAAYDERRGSFVSQNASSNLRRVCRISRDRTRNGTNIGWSAGEDVDLSTLSEWQDLGPEGQASQDATTGLVEQQVMTDPVRVIFVPGMEAEASMTSKVIEAEAVAEAAAAASASDSSSKAPSEPDGTNLPSKQAGAGEAGGGLAQEQEDLLLQDKSRAPVDSNAHEAGRPQQEQAVASGSSGGQEVIITKNKEASGNQGKMQDAGSAGAQQRTDADKGYV
jgi:hypothetical protein